MKLALIDNYDSFTYNLVHLLEQLIQDRVEVIPNDDDRLNDLSAFEALVLSPGPGLPHESGRLMEVIKRYAYEKKILGVCLGHQALALHFGAVLENLPQVFHGERMPIRKVVEDEPLFRGLSFPIQVGRYHSWVASATYFPDALQVTAVDDSNRIMSFRHRTLPLKGVQFHPESILTENGKELISNWLFT
jgi:anthranilate synthase component 2